MISPRIDAVLSDFSTSYFLRNALLDCLKRDPVDALNDAEALLSLLMDLYCEPPANDRPPPACLLFRRE